MLGLGRVLTRACLFAQLAAHNVKVLHKKKLQSGADALYCACATGIPPAPARARIMRWCKHSGGARALGACRWCKPCCLRPLEPLCAQCTCWREHSAMLCCRRVAWRNHSQLDVRCRALGQSRHAGRERVMVWSGLPSDGKAWSAVCRCWAAAPVRNPNPAHSGALCGSLRDARSCAAFVSGLCALGLFAVGARLCCRHRPCIHRHSCHAVGDHALLCKRRRRRERACLVPTCSPVLVLLLLSLLPRFSTPFFNSGCTGARVLMVVPHGCVRAMWCLPLWFANANANACAMDGVVVVCHVWVNVEGQE